MAQTAFNLIFKGPTKKLLRSPVRVDLPFSPFALRQSWLITGGQISAQIERQVECSFTLKVIGKYVYRRL